MIAVHLNHQLTGVWQTNLAIVLTAWTKIPVVPVQMEGFPGWELKKHHEPNLLRLVVAGDWLVFGWGQNELPRLSAMVQRIKTRGRPVEAPGNSILDACLTGERVAAA